MFSPVFRALIPVVFLLVLGCGQKTSLPGIKLDFVETFEVGPDVVVRSLAVADLDSTLLVGTTLGAMEVDLSSGDLRHTWTRENALANEYVFAAFSDASGNKWLGTNGGGISMREQQTGKWRTWFPMHGLADYWVYSFAQQSNGTMWVGTWAGLNTFNLKTGKFHTYLKELVNEWVYGLDVDSLDRVWVGTEGGVNMFDGKQWHVWTHADGLGAPNDQALPFSTNTGLGTRSRHDLSVLASGKSTYNPGYVFALEVDKKDQVWAATWGGGVSVFDGKSWKNWTSKQGLAGDIVYALAEDQTGRIWAGTNRGISWFDGKQWQVDEKANAQLPDQHVYAITNSPEGHIWVGTRGGVTHIKLITQ